MLFGFMTLLIIFPGWVIKEQITACMKVSYNYSTNLGIQRLVAVVCNGLIKDSETLETSF